MAYKLKYLILFIVCGLLLNYKLAFADDICKLTNTGQLNNLLYSFRFEAIKWQGTITRDAVKIFDVLFALEFLWQLVVNKIFAGDVEKLWVYFFTRLTIGYIFNRYLVNIKFYTDIINFFLKTAGKINGYDASLESGFQDISPSAIMSIFPCVSNAIHSIADTVGIVEYITAKIAFGIVLIIIFFILLFIAYMVMEILIKTYFVLYVGFILTGFAGSSWTSSYWQKYFKTICATAIKLFTVCFIMGIMHHQIIEWTDLLNKADTVQLLSGAIFYILGSSAIFALILCKLPDFAANSLIGDISLYGSNKMGSSSAMNNYNQEFSKSTPFFGGRGKRSYPTRIGNRVSNINNSINRERASMTSNNFDRLSRIRDKFKERN